VIPADAGGGAARRLAVAAQLALVLWVAKVYRIEELRRFDRLLPVVLVAFVVLSFLPSRLRVPAFVAASWVGAGVALGPVPALWLVGAGLALIGICRLPVRYPVRIGMLLAAGAGLAAVRAGRIAAPEAFALMLPILGSMFMLRTILFAYDLRHGHEPKGWMALAYFFLLPNACFPLFPAVDSRTFARSRDDSPDTVQKGLTWIARGVLQIVLYRLVYMHVLPAPSEIDGFRSLVLFTVGSYFIYVRISGIFHIAVGILCVFGFDLPETHHRYFAAGGFAELWHRINIYWTSFMTKIVYYPVVMRLRRHGARLATSVAIVAVFASTAVLHAYQWFWLRGGFQIPVNDVLFFGIFGGLVLATALLGKGRKEVGPFVRSFRATGVFLVVSVLWAMWNSPSVAAWAETTWTHRGTPADWGVFALVVVGVAVAGGFVGAARGRVRNPLGPEARVVLVSAGLLVLTVPGLQKRLGPRLGSVLATIDDDRFSQWDEDQVIHGYYEGLLAMNRLNSRAWESQLAKPDEEPLRESEAVIHGDGVPSYVLVPSRETRFRGTTFRTNRWGMRDDDCEKLPAPGTRRIALLGSSYVMGWGVEHVDTFEVLLEARLNEAPPDPEVSRYEILNFAVGGYTLVDQVALVRDVVFDFEPSMVMLVSHTGMKDRELDRLAEYITDGAHERSPVLAELLPELAVDPTLPAEQLRRQLRGGWDRLVTWADRAIVDAARAHGAAPVFVLLPKIRQTELTRADLRIVKTAEEAGFATIVLDSVYGEWDPAAIRLAPWDFHPNELGHRLIASRLYDDLVASGLLLR